ncbi:MAG: hypothetical protein KAT58_08240, partial [candidate division Zixibacteria bacterium]|nr:hypothetical protein [candidate division Zixibacteria bacterium]
MQAILHDAYVKERKLVLLYGALMDGDDPETGEEDFLAVARNDQDGGIELLQEINRKYGNVEIEATIMDKLGENFLQLKSGH